MMFVKLWAEKLNSAFQIAGCRPSQGGEWDHVFVRKIHTWVINASCASEAKHIRKQSWSCQASRAFHSEKYRELTRKWKCTGWNKATASWRAAQTFRWSTVEIPVLMVYCLYTSCFGKLSVSSRVIRVIYTLRNVISWWTQDRESKQTTSWKRWWEVTNSVAPPGAGQETWSCELVPEVRLTGPRAKTFGMPWLLWMFPPSHLKSSTVTGNWWMLLLTPRSMAGDVTMTLTPTYFYISVGIHRLDVSIY